MFCQLDINTKNQELQGIAIDCFSAIVHSAIFAQDISRQRIVEYFPAKKKLFLLYQKKEESIAGYKQSFKALLDVTEQAGVTPGWFKVTAKIAYKATGNGIEDQDFLKESMSDVDKKQVKWFGKKERSVSLRP